MEAKVRAFYERYGRVVLGRARRLLGDPDAANDVLQEVFLRVMTSELHILEAPAPASWLYRVTTNHCLNKLRDEKRQNELLVEGERQGLIGTKGAVPGYAESRALVLQILARMPQEIQEVAVYRYVDEMTHEEIAALVGVSPRTVGNRLVAFQNRMAAVTRREMAR